MKTIAYSELVKVARKVAKKNRVQVLKNPKKNKSPWGKSWDQYPKDYSGKINNLKYPTALGFVSIFLYFDQIALLLHQLVLWAFSFGIYNIILVAYDNDRQCLFLFL